MTVAAASDFQLRPVMFSVRPSPLKLVNYRFGNLTHNLEHRRVNYESRWLRVERKALVSCPTLNKRLSTIKELLPQSDVQFAFQSFANPSVHLGHFFICQCAIFVAVCQSICERLFAFANFSAGEEIKKFNSF